jgi:hypothetical protein
MFAELVLSRHYPKRLEMHFLDCARTQRREGGERHDRKSRHGTEANKHKEAEAHE